MLAVELLQLVLKALDLGTHLDELLVDLVELRLGVVEALLDLRLVRVERGDALSSIRLSLGFASTDDDIDVALDVIPAVVESTAIPISLFILARKLSPTKPPKAAIKWASISGAFFVLTFWLVNTGIWALTVWGSSVRAKGIDYLISFPQNMAGFLITAVGMLALTIYAAHLARVIKAENLSELNLKPAGIIILGTGLFFLSNYLIWIFFGGDNVWSDWYAWLLGHNLDLWMLSLPLVGVPLLFERKAS